MYNNNSRNTVIATYYIDHNNNIILQCATSQGCIQDFILGGETADGRITYTR